MLLTDSERLKKDFIYKGIPLFLAALVLMLVPGIASVSGKNKEEGNKITINQAIEKALANNIQIELAELGIEEAEYAVEAIEEALDKIRASEKEISDLEQEIKEILELQGRIEGIILRIEELEEQLEGNGGNQEEIEREINELQEELASLPDLEELYKLAQSKSIELEQLKAQQMFYNKEQLEVQKKQAERGVDMAELGLEEVKEVVIYGRDGMPGLIDIYSGALLLEDQLKLMEATLKNLKELMRQQEERFAVGFVSKLDVEGLRAQIRSAEAGYEALQHQRKQTHQRLAQLLGMSSDTVFSLEKFTPREPVNVQYDLLLKQELEGNWAIRRAELALGNAEDDLKEVRRAHGKNSARYKQADVAVERARLELKQERDNARASLLAEYHQLLEAETDLANKKADLELARAQYKAMEVRFEIGQITASDLAGARLDLLQKENQLEAARYAYHNALVKLEMRKKRS
ncbi:MAG: TolC family protein [Firmicutes bacterium]|nr:TolC family protein [Bacillota bacterium]